MGSHCLSGGPQEQAAPRLPGVYSLVLLATALAECGCPQCGCPWCASAPTRRVKVMNAREWSAGLGHRWWGAGGPSLAGHKLWA